MSGIPVDLLVDIEGPNQDQFYSACYRNSQFNSEFDDDPFELCSMRNTKCEKDVGLELGLALEKSIKICSQKQFQESPFRGMVTNSDKQGLGILVNLDESPNKKIANNLSMQNCNSSSRDPDSVFTHTASNPFDLAWDVIEQEALSLANHIQDDKEKSISPRKMVDLAMRSSTDSLLLSPREDNNEEAFLINSSPEVELKKTPKVAKVINSRSRTSIASSPVIAKSHTTPSRTRPSIGISSSPLLKMTKPVLPSPAKPVIQRTTFKPPLFRSSSATSSHTGSSVKPILKTAPLKAVHSSHMPPPSAIKPPSFVRSIPETPVRRSLVPSIVPPPSATSTPAFHSKLRAPLTRTESDMPYTSTNKVPEFQRQGSLRYGSKRVSFNPVPISSSSNTASSTNKSAPLLSRLKYKGRENLEP